MATYFICNVGRSDSFELNLLLIVLHLFIDRVKNQRKAVVTTVDKKIPNGILEEQGNVVDKTV